MIYPAAEQRPGLPWKVWGTTNVGEGVICHSAEGYEGGLWSVLDGNAQASWHFSVMRDGRVFQHYPLTASCWHAGSRGQNQRLIGIEHEGVAGEPLTEAQAGASVALVRWIAGVKGWAMQRGITLFEHNEFYPTACPSGRIPWERYVIANAPEVSLEPANESSVSERELDQGERIAFLNKYADDIAVGSDTRVYVDESDPYNLRVRIVTERE